jgi:hypothetical protein
MVFLSPSRQIEGEYVDYSSALFFLNSPNYRTINRRYISVIYRQGRKINHKYKNDAAGV